MKTDESPSPAEKRCKATMADVLRSCRDSYADRMSSKQTLADTCREYA